MRSGTRRITAAPKSSGTSLHDARVTRGQHVLILRTHDSVQPAAAALERTDRNGCRRALMPGQDVSVEWAHRRFGGVKPGVVDISKGDVEYLRGPVRHRSGCRGGLINTAYPKPSVLKTRSDDSSTDAEVMTESDQQQISPVASSAGGGTRTLTLFRAMAPKAITYANFVTPALPESYRFADASCQCKQLWSPANARRINAVRRGF